MAALTCGKGVFLFPKPFSSTQYRSFMIRFERIFPARYMGTTRLIFHSPGDTGLHAYRSQPIIALAFIDEDRVLVGFPAGVLYAVLG